MQPLRTATTACSHTRECPISFTPCPGECVFAEVMQTGSLGIVVVDHASEQTLFVNPAAHHILQDGVDLGDYEALCDLFGLGRDSRRNLSSVSPEPIKIGARLVGFTVYRSRHFVWVLLRDITDKARLEAVAEALELTNNLGYVFSAVRHELGNPVNSMKMALSLLTTNVYNMPREILADYLERMTAEVTRIEGLLWSLKSFSLYETPRPLEVNLSRLVAEFEQIYGGEYRGKGIALEVDAGPPETLALCDPRALQHVLLILLTNAADAVEGTPSPEIRIRVKPNGLFVVLEVGDNGPGMTAEDLRQAFTPFLTTKSQGTGLGLVIAKRTLSKMNGVINLESELGQGTVAVVSLPKA
jgi:signal transduction histidine kinase